MAQVRGLGLKVGGHPVLFCLHRVDRVYGALVVTSWTCYGALYCCIIIIIIIIKSREQCIFSVTFRCSLCFVFFFFCYIWCSLIGDQYVVLYVQNGVP